MKGKKIITLLLGLIMMISTACVIVACDKDKTHDVPKLEQIVANDKTTSYTGESIFIVAEGSYAETLVYLYVGIGFMYNSNTPPAGAGKYNVNISAIDYKSIDVTLTIETDVVIDDNGAVIGLEFEKDVIVIPDEYNGEAVTSIKSLDTENAGMLIVPDSVNLITSLVMADNAKLSLDVEYQLAFDENLDLSNIYIYPRGDVARIDYFVTKPVIKMIHLENEIYGIGDAISKTTLDRMEIAIGGVVHGDLEDSVGELVVYIGGINELREMFVDEQSEISTIRLESISEKQIGIQQEDIESFTALDTFIISGNIKVFERRDKVYSLIIAEGMTEVYEMQFNSIQLSSIVFPSTLVKIGAYAFTQNNALQTLNIPSTVKIIGENAFDETEGLTSLTLNEGLEEIGAGSFIFTNIQNTVVIPSTVKYLGSAFAADVDIINNSPNYEFIDDMLISKDGKNLVHLNSKYVPSGGIVYTVPEGVENIGKYAFLGLKSSNCKILLPLSCVSIGEWISADVVTHPDAKVMPQFNDTKVSGLSVKSLEFTSVIPPKLNETLKCVIKIIVPKGSIDAYLVEILKLEDGVKYAERLEEKK